MTSAVASTRFRDHPPGLTYLFFAELWERFSFYGLRALLVFYVTSEFLYSQQQAFGILATYMALVYATPIIGGYLADRILGDRKAIIIGGIMIAMGHLFLAMPGETFFYIGLAFVVTGTGLFKANVSALLGKLYAHGDYRRDAGFTIYYMGINIGGLLAPLVCGTVGEYYGWHYGFGLAAIGMIVGLLFFFRGLPTLDNHGLPPKASPLREKVMLGLTWEMAVYLLAFVSIPLFAFLIKSHGVVIYYGEYGIEIFSLILIIVEVVVFGYMLYLSAFMEKEDRKSIRTILVLMIFYATFFAMLEQAGSSINFFSKLQVDRYIFGYEIAASNFLSLNPFFILLLGPIIAHIWIALGRRGLEPYTPFKFFLGLFPTALGFVVLVASTYFPGENGLVSLWWVVLAYALHSLGELCISPVGLSMVTRIAPPQMTGALMGVLFLSVAWGNHLAGIMAKLSSTDDHIGETAVNLLTYRDAFSYIAYIGLGVSLVMLILSPFLNGAFKREEKMKGYNE
ncbi:MAG: MFS transporter [Alphaproteobacteria bacterium]|nr:MFS transporter [Alphaproteobacteria bacterium]